MPRHANFSPTTEHNAPLTTVQRRMPSQPRQRVGRLQERCPVTTVAEQRERSREAQARRRAKPGVREQERERMRARRASPQYKENELATARAVRRDPKLWAKSALPQLRYRAKARGLECTITADDLLVPEICPVLGIPIFAGYQCNALHNPNSPSVDRLDSTRGYTPDNVRVISLRANLLKKDATVAEMAAVLAYMVREGAP